MNNNQLSSFELNPQKMSEITSSLKIDLMNQIPITIDPNILLSAFEKINNLQEQLNELQSTWKSPFEIQGMINEISCLKRRLESYEKIGERGQM